MWQWHLNNHILPSLMKFSEQRIYQELTNGNEEVLGELVDYYLPQYLKWVSKNSYPFSSDVIEDIFMDAIITFYKAVREGTFQYRRSSRGSFIKKQASIKTYLFDICKKRLINANEHYKVRLKHQENIQEKIKFEDILNPSRKVFQDDRKKILDEALNKLPNTEKQILIFRYYYNYSMEVIAERLDLKNKDVAKTLRYKAVKKLKGIIAENYEKEDLF